MPTVQPMDRNLVDPAWYGVILGAIFSILQLIYQGESGGGGVSAVESHFHLLKKTVSLYASLSLISLTSGNPLPSTNPFRFSLLFAILVVAAPLSAAVPTKLWWLPYLSCIRPLYDLLLNLYLFCTDIPLDSFWDFCNSTVNAAYQFKLSALQIIQRFMPIFVVVGTSSAETNSNSEGGIRNTEA